MDINVTLSLSDEDKAFFKELAASITGSQVAISKDTGKDKADAKKPAPAAKSAVKPATKAKPPEEDEDDEEDADEDDSEDEDDEEETPPKKPAVKPASKTVAKAKALTHDEVRDFIGNLLKDNPDLKDKVQAIIKKAGVKKLAEVPADKLQGLYAKIKELAESEDEDI